MAALPTPGEQASDCSLPHDGTRRAAKKRSPFAAANNMPSALLRGFNAPPRTPVQLLEIAEVRGRASLLERFSCGD
jgi:hypothetical protein